MRKEADKMSEKDQWNELYERIHGEISIDRMYEDMEVLVNEIGERLSGTEELHRCASYIEERLAAAGLEARIDKFPMYHSFPGEAELKVLSPETRTVDIRPVCHISSTLPCGMEGEMIYLGSGSYEDYQGIDAKGKIVLTDMNWTPGRPEKARIAWEMGAKALIIMNWGASDSTLIQMGAVKSQWGNPDPDTFEDIPQITVASVSRASGEYLKELCQKGTVKIWLRAEATREWVEAWQPIGFLKGGKSNGQYVLVGSHIDAWGKSAICNATGNALNMELARVFYQHREELTRDIVFVFWDGHEIAEGGGSTWYCDHYWKEMTRSCVAYLNIDNLAIKGTTEPGVESLPELKPFLMERIEEVWNRQGLWHNAYKGGGDSSFFGVGVPYIAFATEYTEEKLKELNYAFYSPWLHSDSDTIDKIDRESYAKHMDYFFRVLFDLTESPVIPYDVKALAANIRRQYEELITLSPRDAFYVEDLEPAVSEYERMAEDVRGLSEALSKGGDAQKVEALNTLLLRLERETTVFRNVAGRYGQDACCYLPTERPIPALAGAILEISRYEEGSHEYYLWQTKVIREKNRAFDALNNSLIAAEQCFKQLQDTKK